MADEAAVMGLKVVARRGDTLMLADSGPGVVLVRPGMEPAVIHRDSAFARGYWQAADEPAPDVSDEVRARLATFNSQWEQAQRVLRGEETSESAARSEDISDDDLAIIRAAGHDTTPGNDELHHWWVYGPGRSRWHTWTELVAALVEAVEGKPLETLKRWAAAWFHERYGFWPGDDRNRVRQGKPPRGERVGPG